MTITNHWGVWVDSEIPTTGVLSIYDVAWEWIADDICLTCEEIADNIEKDKNLTSEEKQAELEYMECDPSHTRIFGDWIKDGDGKYMPNPNGEFSAILQEATVQVVFSSWTKRGALCSPCYPGQVDLDSPGEFLGYTLPDDLLCK